MSQGLEVRLSPTECARNLLSKLDVRSVPIFPRKIAKEMGIFVQEKEADSGYDGFLMCVNGAWGIMVNSAIRSRARKRFTVAHELGHYCISYHNGDNYLCFRKDISAMDSSARQDEKEANEFAVELLMPEKSFSEDMRQREVNLQTINWLATRYDTSMTSTAIRYARSSPHVCAVVLSEQGKIKYFAYSEGFRKERRLYLSRNAPLQNGSYAKELFDLGFQTPDKQGEVAIGSWFASGAHPGTVLLEHSRCLTKFNQVLSLIWFAEKYNTTPQPIAHVLVE